ncbi:tRNA (uridine(34)/cytosine(34)/5-carboxymethylaminomethyluridine(34)-2'-O)-methyltransferase TrmL [Idiomarina tyrosinivorans]|uniref:tRNA (cytidine(34)-2'-O)-methyltransferase n=1 Tax=Idiomarina tyrosinivorans TaxID=1445662 RepID=A0A432ZQ53_9GAMM|nr:tRNA (cytidine(34)-2'-O)-methyltransferase [Idiomarina tyrosinivorans]RUO79956.1 tRNA (uridine(34)/cytosine(34)/5-carboxymethylaminomethyluridine(34)-2'-O)-methyltransferase TrmL [Idiomarina tyrosinivorans]
MFDIALHEPKMPPNTGNIIRLVANNGCRLHLIEPLGFSLDEKSVRRAGLDYNDMAVVKVHKDYQAFKHAVAGQRIFAVETHATQFYHEPQYQPGDVLLFGSETAGLPQHILDDIGQQFAVRIPMMPSNRSLNLSNSVAIVSYEAWRQQHFQQGS